MNEKQKKLPKKLYTVSNEARPANRGGREGKNKTTSAAVANDKTLITKAKLSCTDESKLTKGNMSRPFTKKSWKGLVRVRSQ